MLRGGTWGGASRFDGKSWKRYTTLDGLANNVVWPIAAASDGALRSGTEGGVSRFDGTSWKSYTTLDGLADNNHIVAWQQGWRRVALRGASRQHSASADDLVDINVQSIQQVQDFYANLVVALPLFLETDHII